MKQMLKLALSLLSVGLVVALAFFGWSVKAKDDATFHLANGVEVTPVEVKRDDVAQLIDAKLWKFDVVCPAKANTITGISFGQNGKPYKEVVGGFGESSATEPMHFQCTIGLMPIGGTFYDAKELKYSISYGEAGANTGTIPNPLIRSHGYTQDAEVIPAQNHVLLMSSNLKKTWISGRPSFNEVALALDFEVFHYKK